MDLPLRCGLSGQMMSDPVIVVTEFNSQLILGMSYERETLMAWLVERGDSDTRFVSNPALKQIIASFRAAGLIPH